MFVAVATAAAAAAAVVAKRVKYITEISYPLLWRRG